MGSDKATTKGSLLGAWLPKEHTTRVAKFIQRSNLRSKMMDEETQAGSPPVVVPSSIEQSLRDHFERILLISEGAAASLAEQVMEVFNEKEDQAQQLTGHSIPSLSTTQKGRGEYGLNQVNKDKTNSDNEEFLTADENYK